MYQVVINDKYYINGVDISAMCTYGEVAISSFEATSDKYEAKFFENKIMAQSIARQVGGEVIEYVEKKDIQIKIDCNAEPEKVLEQLEITKRSF